MRGTGKLIVITSGKGGTGKTTTTAAVSSCLAALGHRTLAIDCDIGLRNLDVSLAMSDFAVKDFLDVLSGEVELADAMHEHPHIPNLFFLAAPAFAAPEDIPPDKLHNMLDLARESFDYVIIDCPAGLGAGFRLAASYADLAVIVATGDASSLRDASRAVTELSELGIAEIRLLINRFNRPHARRWNLNIDDFIDAAGARLLGVVREDPRVSDAICGESPLVLYATKGAAMDFLSAARRLAGEELPI